MTKLPKFAIGEVVIFVDDTEEWSFLNGEYTIHDISTPIISEQCSMGSNTYSVPNIEDGVYCYSLGPNLLGDGIVYAVTERLLRKKHQPGEMSFTELMSSLNVPNKEKLDA